MLCWLGGPEGAKGGGQALSTEEAVLEIEALAQVLYGVERGLEWLPEDSVWRRCLLEFRNALRPHVDEQRPMSPGRFEPGGPGA